MYAAPVCGRSFVISVTGLCNFVNRAFVDDPLSDRLLRACSVTEEDGKSTNMPICFSYGFVIESVAHHMQRSP